ncbi:unnamed protein product [Ixodes pacificus]
MCPPSVLTLIFVLLSAADVPSGDRGTGERAPTPTNGTDASARGDDATIRGQGDWERRLKGCEKYLDLASTSHGNSTIHASDVSRVRLEHPFLSLVDGVIPNVTYRGKSRLWQDLG